MVKVRMLHPVEPDFRRPVPEYRSSLVFVDGLIPTFDLPYGLNIGSIVTDLCEERGLCSFELMSHRGNWQVAPLRDWPTSARAASLEFSHEAVDHNFYDVDVSVTTNPERTRVFVQFDQPEGAAQWFALSEHCLAWVDGDRLLGFFIELDPERVPAGP
mgnify:CR=1 FL=1